MKILALLQPAAGSTPDKVVPLLAEETKHAWELYKSDVAREYYMRADGKGVVIVLECKDVEAAREVVQSLPLAKAGFVEVQLIPLAPFAVWDQLAKH